VILNTATFPYIAFIWQLKSVSSSFTAILYAILKATFAVFIIITLHRPWLLRKLKSNKYALSRKACFDAAKMDFRIVSFIDRPICVLRDTDLSYDAAASLSSGLSGSTECICGRAVSRICELCLPLDLLNDSLIVEWSS